MLPKHLLLKCQQPRPHTPYWEMLPKSVKRERETGKGGTHLEPATPSPVADVTQFQPTTVQDMQIIPNLEYSFSYINHKLWKYVLEL